MGRGTKEEKRDISETRTFLHSKAARGGDAGCVTGRVCTHQHSSPILARRFSRASSFWLASSMAL